MKRSLAILGLLVSTLLIACQPSPSPTPTPRPTPVVRHAPDVDYRAALAALDTYRARASLDVYPAESTGLKKAHLEIEVDAINRPERARRTTIRGLRSLTNPEERRRTADVLKFVEVGGSLYMSTGVTWLKTPAQNNPEQGFLDPALLIPDPTLFTQVATNVEVNGVRADHYTFSDPEALAYLAPDEREDVTAVKGNVWLAREGHFVVRYRATIHGNGFRFDFSPAPFPGRVEVAYDIYGPNEPLTITPPQDALGETPKQEPDKPIVLEGFGNAPLALPADASIVMSTPQLVVLNTALTPEEVARFYANAFAEAGWEQVAAETKATGSIRERWQKQGYELHLTIVSGKEDTEQTHVTIGVNVKK